MSSSPRRSWALDSTTWQSARLPRSRERPTHSSVRQVGRTASPSQVSWSWYFFFSPTALTAGRQVTAGSQA